VKKIVGLVGSLKKVETIMKRSHVHSLAGIFITLFCFIVALIPETAMYLVYHLISPTTETGRIVTGGLMLWFGTGLSVFFAVGAFMLWVALMKVVLE
jgi:hypothetical protein